MAHILAKVFRFNPALEREPRYATYSIETDAALSVQAIVRRIYRDLDRTVAFRNYNCYLGVCTCCLVRLDGRPVRSCCTLVEPGQEITIGPVDPDDVIRDLVTVLR